MFIVFINKREVVGYEIRFEGESIKWGSYLWI